MAAPRETQLAYSEIQELMSDETSRRRKGAKIVHVLRHFLGRETLDGLTVADVGCSTGYIADELANAGANPIGVDIDVPGLHAAESRFGGRVAFVCANGEALPLPDRSLDVVVFNHIYEHVVSPEAVLAELHRVLKPGGALYLGLANRLGVIEPHHRLPFLSYLSPPLADRYVRASGRGNHYYERLRTRWGLRRLLRDFSVWDYTLPVVHDPQRFASADTVSARVSAIPPRALQLALPLVPTYIWVATTTPGAPAGPALPVPPRVVRTG